MHAAAIAVAVDSREGMCTMYHATYDTLSSGRTRLSSGSFKVNLFPLDNARERKIMNKNQTQCNPPLYRALDAVQLLHSCKTHYKQTNKKEKELPRSESSKEKRRGNLQPFSFPTLCSELLHRTPLTTPFLSNMTLFAHDSKENYRERERERRTRGF